MSKKIRKSSKPKGTLPPSKLKQKAHYADPVPDESYASGKNFLWSKYNAIYYPAFQEFRNKITDAVMAIGENPGANYKQSIMRMPKARNKYIKIACKAFTEYIEALTKLYTEDKIRSFHIDLTKARIAASKIKPKKKKRGKKA